MGTRARVGIENADGHITSIYTHWDGDPSHHGPILTGSFATLERVTELMTLGDLSILGEEIGERHPFDNPDNDVCTAYGRDRDETGVDAVTHYADSWPDYGQVFEYLFRQLTQDWVVRAVGRDERSEWFELSLIVSGELLVEGLS